MPPEETWDNPGTTRGTGGFGKVIACTLSSAGTGARTAGGAGVVGKVFFSKSERARRAKEAEEPAVRPPTRRGSQASGRASQTRRASLSDPQAGHIEPHHDLPVVVANPASHAVDMMMAQAEGGTSSAPTAPGGASALAQGVPVQPPSHSAAFRAGPGRRSGSGSGAQELASPAPPQAASSAHVNPEDGGPFRTPQAAGAGRVQAPTGRAGALKDRGVGGRGLSLNLSDHDAGDESVASGMGAPLQGGAPADSPPGAQAQPVASTTASPAQVAPSVQPDSPLVGPQVLAQHCSCTRCVALLSWHVQLNPYIVFVTATGTGKQPHTIEACIPTLSAVGVCVSCLPVSG